MGKSKVIGRSSRRMLASCALGLMTWASGSALARQSDETPPPGAGTDEHIIGLGGVPRLHFTTLGRVVEDGVQLERGTCPPVVSSHTDANFQGGSFVVQAGFAEGETAAVSYVLSASAFPIKVELMEVILATSNASVQTTTQWSIIVWDGTPATGQIVAEYSSDGVILPHAILPPGTAGVNIMVSVDPQDPEQIYVYNNSGTNTVSFGFRIDDHHQEPANPCTQSPPTCCNAFPCTDVSGLAQPTHNWLGAINCGAFGCPPGFTRFSSLPIFCRPSGDWVMRMTWSSVNCVPAVGACCLPTGTCQVLSQNDCTASGGTYQGDGTLCGQVNCPQPTGACCFQATGGCLNLSQANCQAAGGIYKGNGTNCGTIVCFPIGACCLPNGSCVGNVSPETCESQGGVFQGHETTCGTVNCPLPQGGCCFATGFCLLLTEADCGTAGGTWGGIGSNCFDGNGNGTADLCEAPPGCTGDLDGDFDVDSTDLNVLLSDFGCEGLPGDCAGDADDDGDTDSTDLNIVLSVFGEPCG